MEAAVNGGGENNNYYLSLNHYDQDGIIAKSGMHRDAIRASMNVKANDWLRVGFKANLGYESYETNSNVTQDGIYVANPMVAARKFMPSTHQGTTQSRMTRSYTATKPTTCTIPVLQLLRSMLHSTAASVPTSPQT